LWVPTPPPQKNWPQLKIIDRILRTGLCEGPGGPSRHPCHPRGTPRARPGPSPAGSRHTQQRRAADTLRRRGQPVGLARPILGRLLQSTGGVRRKRPTFHAVKSAGTNGEASLPCGQIGNYKKRLTSHAPKSEDTKSEADFPDSQNEYTTQGQLGEAKPHGQWKPRSASTKMEANFP